MPQSKQIFSVSNGVYEVVDVGATSYIAIAATVDGSSNPVWQVGRCTDLSGGGFVAMFEVNCGTGVVTVNGVTLVVP